jgi:serpin B
MARLHDLVLAVALLTAFCHATSALAQPHERAPLTADQAIAVAGNNAFAIDLFHELRAIDPHKNLLASPYSVSTALAMTYAGARHRTAQQMADVLHVNLPDDRFHAALGGLIADYNVPRTGYEMSVANRLFGQQHMPFRQPFLDINRHSYGAPLEEVNFASDPEGARVHINDWVADQTRERIQDLLPPGSIDGLTRLVLTNAIYFNGHWKYQFDPDETRDAAFHVGPHDTIQTPTMHQRAEFRYGSFGNFQMLEMPYTGDDLSMVIMLPAQPDGLAELQSHLTLELFEQSVSSLHEQEVDVYLPKFSYSDEVNLAQTLQHMGMTDAFDLSHADFDGIADRDLYDLYITGVFHKAFIDVNEVGTEAAAATGVVIGVTSVPPPPPEFRANHPFLFALRDVHSGSLLFFGRVVEPEIVAPAAAPPPLAGDFNGDGVVDAADYIVWRKSGGENQAAYHDWRTNFQRVAGAGSSAATAVPEPAVPVTLLAGLLSLVVGRPTRSG